MKKKYLLGFLFIIMSSIIGALIPYLLSMIIDNKNQFFYSLDNKILVALLFLIHTLFITIGNFQFVDISEEILYRFRQKIIKNILYTSMKDADNLEMGKIPSHIDNNLKFVQEYYASSLPSFINSIFVFFISLIFLFKIDVKLTLLLFLLLPILATIIIPITILSGKYSDKYQEEAANYIEKIYNIFNNILYIKVLNAQKEITEKLDKNNQNIRKYSSINNKINSFVQPFLMLVLLAVLSLVFVYGANRVTKGFISIGSLIAFLLYVFQLLSPVSGISYYFSSLSKKNANIKEINQYLELKDEEVNDKAENINLESIENIEFKNVSFDYKDDISFIRNLNLKINKGEKIAIVGDSGAGKSTLFKLLLKLYLPKDGVITFNSKNIMDIPYEKLRNKFTLIPQENSIIGSNLIDFLELGNKKIDEVKIKYYIHLLKLDKKFNLDNLNNINFGVGGKSLSTGEKQRILILKALLDDFDILLMDESTSALDSELENEVFDIIENEFSDKILISIAHRLSTVKHVDRVIFFENGKITGDDSHYNLYNNHSRYKNYIDLQNIKTNEVEINGWYFIIHLFLYSIITRRYNL